MDYPKSVPGVGLVGGKFIDENTATGQVGSLIPSVWGNNVTDELLAVILAGELEPDEANHSQLLQAILSIIQGAIPSAPGGATETDAGVLKLVSDLLLTAGVDDTRAVTTKKLVAKLRGQGFTAFTTNGAAPSFTLTPVPAITAYTASLRFRVKFNGAGNGANTLNISGLGAKNIKQYDSTGAKVAAVFAANQLADIEYDGTDFVLLNPVVSITKTISPFDATPGSVTVTGDGGWNSSGTPAAALVSDADAWTVSGSARTGPAWTGSPYPGAQGRNQGTLLHQCGFSDATYASQLFLGISSDNLWFRRKTANVWGAPVELWHTGNLAAKAQCTAWVNFNGSGTVTTRDSYNVSSITDNGVGDYTVKFATAMANANYVPTISVQAPTSGAVTRTGVIYATSSTSANGLGTTAARILVGNTSGTTNLEDNATVAFSVIGGV